MAGQSRAMLLGVGAGVGIAIGAVIYWRHRNKIPSEWRKVGEIADLMCFPVKSCAPVREFEMECVQLGLKKGKLRDRVFMVIGKDGEMKSARTYPNMVLITPSISGSILTLKAPGMMDVEIDIDELHKNKTFLPDATVWTEPIPSIDCGEEAARWFSRFVLSEDSGLRLVYYPYETSVRNVREKNIGFKKLSIPDGGGYPDCTNYMLISESSIGDLNTRIEKTVTPQYFRPNFVVKGSEAYEEDDWDWIKIGKNTIFRNIKPCTRCIFTNIDPETGMRDKNMEPLKTLKKYRLISDPELRTYAGDSPVMGIHLGIRVKGPVKLGDPVYVNVS